MEQITILGSETLLAKHLVKIIEKRMPAVSLKLWNNDWSLYDALHGSNIVFNLHEVQDFSLIPDVKKMQKQNVEFVAELLDKCKLHNCPTLIVHLSSTYLQCSTKWPNVNGRESEAFQMYRGECPFPEYCESKFEAEQLIGYADKLGRVVARVGPLYGEEDCHSLVCDSILATQALGMVPRIGQPKDMGVLQFTYAGNAADALLTCAEKLKAEMGEEMGKGSGTHQPCETVIISDNTPLRDIYTLLLEPIQMEEEDEEELDESPLVKSVKEEENSKDGGGEEDGTGSVEVGAKPEGEETKDELAGEDGKQSNISDDDDNGGGPVRLSSWHCPFWCFFLPYSLLCLLIWASNRILRMKTRKLPSPNYLYLLLRHWTFYSGYKLRIYFNWRPPVDWETAIQRSRVYYRQLKPKDIRGPSWLPVGEEGKKRLG